MPFIMSKTEAARKKLATMAEERKMRQALAVTLRLERRSTRRIRSFGPAYAHLRRMERRELRELRVLAMLEANMACRKDRGPVGADFASYKLYLQREAYLRQQQKHENAVGGTFSKLFDVKYHLSGVNGQTFEDCIAMFPLRPVAEQPYWEPKWAPYVPLVVTDGSMVVGDVRTWQVEQTRFSPVSAALFERDYPWESRFLYGPIDAFVNMKTTTGEAASDSADSAVPDKAIKGKKHPRRVDSRSAVKAQRKKQGAVAKPNDAGAGKKATISTSNLGPQPATVPASGFVDCYDYALPSAYDGTEASSSTDNASSSQKTPQKKSSKKASFTPYVEYDDPTLPTAEDVAEQKRADWKQKYISGETLYQWVSSSLTETLSSNLYFDESAPSLRSTSEFVIPSDPSSSSVYFDETSTAIPRSSSFTSDHFDFRIPDGPSPSVYFDSASFTPVSIPSHSSDSSWISGDASDLFFSENDISKYDNDDLDSLISSCEDSIYFDHVSISSSYSTALEQSWNELDESNSSSLYFDAASATSALTPLAQQLAEPIVTCTPLSSSQSFTEDESFVRKSFDDPVVPLALFGNPSLSIDFVQ